MRGSGLAPTSIDTIEPSKAKIVICDLLQLHEMGKCNSDAEVEQRLQDYFELCRNTSLRPGVESMSAALHIDRATLWRWEQGQGCSPRRTEAIRSAKSMIASYVEQASLQGLLNPVTAIFLSKNWLGYKDQVQYEPLRPDNRFESLSQEELQKRIPVYSEDPEPPESD